MRAIEEADRAADNKAVKIQIRATKEVRDQIDKAATVKNVTRTEFMLRAAKNAAEEALLDQCVFSLDADRWERFVEALEAPIPNASNLKSLLKRKPAWEK